MTYQESIFFAHVARCAAVIDFPRCFGAVFGPCLWDVGSLLRKRHLILGDAGDLRRRACEI